MDTLHPNKGIRSGHHHRSAISGLFNTIQGQQMNINKISNNQTELTLGNGVKVLFSYSTPVASWEDGQFFKTDKSWSKTTARHINAWTHCAVIKPQSYFDNLTAGV